MAATFTKYTDWFCERLRPYIEDGGDAPPGAPSVAATGYTWQRTIQEAWLYRLGEGLTAFTHETGGVAKGDLVTFKNGASEMTLSSADTYTVMDHELCPEGDQGADHWRESLVWRTESAWYQVPVSVVPTTTTTTTTTTPL